MSQLLNYTLEVYSFEDGICNGYFDCNAEAAQAQLGHSIMYPGDSQHMLINLSPKDPSPLFNL